jgi:hypothetical protein
LGLLVVPVGQESRPDVNGAYWPWPLRKNGMKPPNMMSKLSAAAME